MMPADGLPLAAARVERPGNGPVLTAIVTSPAHAGAAASAPPGVPWLARSRFRGLIARPGRVVLAVR